MPIALGMASLTLGGADRVAFAVYSADDSSLDFYKRMDVPEAGDTFEGKTVTEVYTDFENKHYVFETEGSNHVPWFDIRKKVKSVKVVDDGIQPYYTHAWFAQMESLTDCDITKLDTSHTTVFYDMFNGCTSLESLNLTHMDTSSAIYMGYMLKNCPQLKTVDVSSFDTSKCQDLSIFFSGDKCLTEIKGLGNWNTSSCRWMTLMFNGCGSLTQIRGLENWDVHSVEIMDSMFEQCQKLQNVDISHFEGKSLKSTEAMFFHCYGLTTVDVSKLVTGTCTDIGCMFDGCTGLTSIQGLDKWDVSNIKDCHQAFYYCCSLQKIDLTNWQFSPSGTIQAMFYNCSSLRELNLSGFDLHEAESGWGLFESVIRLQRITLGPDWKWFDVNGYLPNPSSDNILGADGKWYSVTTGRGYAPADIPAGKADTYVASKELLPKIAFAVYSADDASLDFYKRAFCDVPAAGSTFERKTVTDIYTGFEDTEYHVVSVGSDGTSWDADAKTNTPWFGRRKNIKTVQVVDSGIKPKSIQSWFQGLENATNLSMSKLDVSTCASFCNAFANCQAATSIDISGWSAKPVDMTQMFYMCKSVSTLDLSGFDGSRNITLNSTFHACFNLDDIKFGDKWTTVSVENFGCAFFGTKFRKFDVSGWNTSKGYIFRGTFGNMKNLEEIDISGWTNAGAEHDGQEILPTFDSDPKLRTVKVGSGWDWSKINAKLPAISDENVAGADGKWYAASDGTGYAPADIPSGKADIYYSVAPSTFAVFSSDDGSLDFYNRAGKPFVGDTWQGKSVDGVYTGFETTLYHSSWDDTHSSNNNGPTNCPWYEHHDDVLSVSVIDYGIKPYSMSFWFQLFSNLKTVDIKKLDVSACRDWQHTFWCCRLLTELDLSGMNVLQLGNIESMFTDCRSLKSVSFSGWKGSPTASGIMFSSCRSLESIDFGDIDFSKTEAAHSMFENCNFLTLDCSNWNISANIRHDNFNYGAPGVIAPKAWQPTAFAVFSADDGSLNFYKREFKDIPSVGSTFEGKTVTEVYTGFETTVYDTIKPDDLNGDVNTPWFGHASDILSVAVVDEGICPNSMWAWFQHLKNCTSFDLSKLNTSATTSFGHMFFNCFSIKSIDISSWDMSNATETVAMFGNANKLVSVQFGKCDFSNVKNFGWMFAHCDSLLLDCSDWTVRKDASHIAFAAYNLGVILPKSWQETSDATISSADDAINN